MKTLLVLIFNLHLLFLSTFVGYATEQRLKLDKGQIAPYSGILLPITFENALIDKIKTLESENKWLKEKLVNRDALIAEKVNENKLWQDQVKNFNEFTKMYESKYNKVKKREDIMLANTFIAYSLLLSIIAGGVTYGILNYSDNGVR